MDGGHGIERPSAAPRDLVVPSDGGKALKALHPAAYYRQFLKHGIHPGKEARSIRAARPTSIVKGTVGTADGSGMVQLGSTVVVTGIKAEACRPRESTPHEGRIEIEVHLPPLCSSRYTTGAAPSEAYALSQFLTSTIAMAGSGIVDLRELSIEEGTAAFMLRVDVLVVEDDGSVVDAALLSLHAALANLQLPRAAVTVDASGVPRVTVDPRTKHGIAVGAPLVPLSFAIIDDIIVPDPTAEEELVASTTFTVVCASRGGVASVFKSGGAALAHDHFRAALSMARRRTESVAQLHSRAR